MPTVRRKILKGIPGLYRLILERVRRFRLILVDHERCFKRLFTDAPQCWSARGPHGRWACSPRRGPATARPSALGVPCDPRLPRPVRRRNVHSSGSASAGSGYPTGDGAVGVSRMGGARAGQSARLVSRVVGGVAATRVASTRRQTPANAQQGDKRPRGASATVGRDVECVHRTVAVLAGLGKVRGHGPMARA